MNQKINEEIGHPHRSYAEVAYDALWIMALSNDKVGVQADTDTRRRTLIETASSFDGITGNTILNNAGDRNEGSYDFWAITRKEDSRIRYEWQRVDSLPPME